MQVFSVLSAPVNFIARGLRQLVTTSGNITPATRYQRHDAAEGGLKFKIFNFFRPQKKTPFDGGKPLRPTPAEAGRDRFDDARCFHVKTKYFLGVPFRQSEFAVANRHSKKVATMFFRSDRQFDATDRHGGLSRKNSAVQSAADDVYRDDCMRSPSDDGDNESVTLSEVMQDFDALYNRETLRELIRQSMDSQPVPVQRSSRQQCPGYRQHQGFVNRVGTI